MCKLFLFGWVVFWVGRLPLTILDVVVSNLGVCNFYAFALFCALLRSFAPFCKLCARLQTCARLHPFALICAHLRVSASGEGNLRKKQHEGQISKKQKKKTEFLRKDFHLQPGLTWKFLLRRTWSGESGFHSKLLSGTGD